MQPFREVLGSRVILADGAMGTELYRRGVFINRCYDELCLSRPALVRAVHEEYLKAGAEVLSTNSYGANSVRLTGYGLGDRVTEINRAAAQLAKEVADGRAWVAGSVGPLGKPMEPAGPIHKEEAAAAYREQILALAEGGVDLILLETFGQLAMLKVALQAARAVCDLPVIASSTLSNSEGEWVGMTPEDMVSIVQSWGPDAVGANCLYGPQILLDAVERMSHVAEIPISVMPNAGNPELVDGRTLYLATPEYMAEYARRFAQKGASIIGGCCGTTPAMVAEMSAYLRSVQPRRARITPQSESTTRTDIEPLEPTPLAERTAFGAALADPSRFLVSVELEPPRGLDASRAVRGAAYLKKVGVDAVNIPDGPRAVARMSAGALAELVDRDSGLTTIVHYCCRDRNVLGIQMDLIGAHALGVKNLLCVTGDPPKMGSYPDATAVFDLDSIGLLRLAANMNRGLDFGGHALGGKTDFVLGCGCNPGAVDLDLEVERYRLKLEAGAEFVFSQPVFDAELLERFLDRVKGFRQIPFFAGIMPLASFKNAEFLHNEVPGMQVPQRVRDRLAAEATREGQRRVGIEVAQESLSAFRSMSGLRGTYIFPPFGRYRAVERVLSVLDEA